MEWGADTCDACFYNIKVKGNVISFKFGVLRWFSFLWNSETGPIRRCKYVNANFRTNG